MINTYNESKLHKTLKELYQIQNDGVTEVPVGNYICDIVSSDGNVIEIQTKNLGKLMPKIYALHDAGKKVLLVHPIPQTTIIESYSEDGIKLNKRKSPKKQDWYDLYAELMGIYPLMNEEWFQLEALLVTVKEIRVKTAEPVQTVNKSRRFRKRWYKKDKELVEIIDTKRFSGPKSFLSILPDLPQEFCAKDLSPITGSNTAYKILWVLRKAGIIVPSRKEGRTTYYSSAIE